LIRSAAGSILVNPWNINDVAAAIEDALTMSEEERRERHRQNFMHVATHTAQVRVIVVCALETTRLQHAMVLAHSWLYAAMMLRMTSLGEVYNSTWDRSAVAKRTASTASVLLLCS
jgi:archaellum biogenesis ATPase FlaH